MDDVINWLLDNIPQPFRGWIVYVAQAIRTIVNQLLDVLFGATRAFLFQFPFVKGFVDWLINAFTSVFRVCYWLITVKIPGMVNWAVWEAHRLAIQFINDTAAFLRSLIDRVEHLATQLVSAVWDWLGPVWKWIQQRIAWLVNGVVWLLHQVTELLTDPGKLAAWLAGAMLGALGRYILANDRRLARMAWRILLPGTLMAARELETIITDIF